MPFLILRHWATVAVSPNFDHAFAHRVFGQCDSLREHIVIQFESAC